MVSHGDQITPSPSSLRWYQRTLVTFTMTLTKWWPWTPPRELCTNVRCADTKHESYRAWWSILVHTLAQSTAVDYARRCLPTSIGYSIITVPVMTKKCSHPGRVSRGTTPPTSDTGVNGVGSLTISTNCILITAWQHTPRERTISAWDVTPNFHGETVYSNTWRFAWIPR